MMFRSMQRLAAAGLFVAAGAALGQAPQQQQQDPPQIPPQQQQNPPQNQNGQKAVTTLRGQVVRVEGQDRVIIRTTDNRDLTLIASPTTTYVIDGKTARFGDLRNGVNLSAVYTLNNNQYMVSSIQVGNAPNQPAQPGAAQVNINERRFRGKIVSVNAATNQIVAKSEDGAQLTLMVQKNGRFLRNGQALRFADLQIGTLIETQYVERDGYMWVEEVTVVTEQTPPAVPPATQPPQQTQDTVIQGTVVRIVGTNQVVIRTSDNKEMTVDLVPQTVYTFNDQPGRLTDFQAGQNVRISYNVRDRRPIASRLFGNRR
jgi:hypothetical protein